MSSDPTLIRGADGALYYLPPGELDSFRVDDDTASKVMSKLAEAAGTTEDALTEDADVSGFSFDTFSTKLTPLSLGLNPSARMLGDDDKTMQGLYTNTMRPGR